MGGKCRGYDLLEDTSTPPAKEEWEKEFDKINLCNCMRVCLGHDDTKEKLKVFISSLRSQSYKEGRRETIEALPKLAEEYEKEMTSGLKIGYIHGIGNVHLFVQKAIDALNDAIEVIKGGK